VTGDDKVFRKKEVRNMIAKISLVMIAFVAVLSLVGFVQVPAASAVILDHSYRGHVTSYDQATNTLVVHGKWGDKSFDVSNAHVNSMLLPNESVTVTYFENGGTMVASSVGVLGGEPYLGGGAYGSRAH
jgi:hypothetical protein